MNGKLKEYEQASLDAETLFQSLGIETQISTPVSDVRDDWPNILYNVTFSKHGQNLTTEYRLGVGHVDWKRARIGCYKLMHLTADEESLVMTRQSKPFATFKNKALEASAAAKLAVFQKVAPKPYEVLAAICDDSLTAHDSSWENYAADFGLDTDSIKGKATYDFCASLYHKVVALIGSDNVRKLAELHRQF